MDLNHAYHYFDISLFDRYRFSLLHSNAIRIGKDLFKSVYFCTTPRLLTKNTV